ncbi:MAG: SDR family oxidoreductase [Saprospiraceae bacterium]|nr:SDR family oxidoreductase [Saprospiraceae bacterium]
MILVTGATGHLGKAVVNGLLKKINPADIAVLVRQEAQAAHFRGLGVNVRIGDYDHSDSLVKAFTGIDKLYFISSSDLHNRVPQHTNVVNAAIKAGVQHIVYTSFQRVNETESSPIASLANAHLVTEKLIKDSGMTYTILQHGLYFETIPRFIGENILETKTIFTPAGQGRTAYALRAEQAEAGVNILLGKGHENKEYVLAGVETSSYGDVAEAISKVTNTPVTYYSPSLEEFTQTLTQANVPDIYIGLFAGFSSAIQQGEFAKTSGDLEQLLGRKPSTLNEFITSHYSSN